MKTALGLLVATTLVLVGLRLNMGYQTVYEIAYGAVVGLAASISATFFWLWHTRQTPLALGMGCSWAGTSGVMGWWWLFNRLERPGFMSENEILFFFVACYFVGGILHFQVILRSLGAKAWALLLPMIMLVAASL
jgi:hypothetical protein